MRLSGRIYRDDEGIYVSSCTELDISTCADSFEEVVKSTMDMIACYFKACAKDGTLRRELDRLHSPEGESIPVVAELDAPTLGVTTKVIAEKLIELRP
jgi:predicted RNase H-like HicB family nuclease